LSVPKIVVHTDVLVRHLSGRQTPSVLRFALQKFFCYTTVFQAIEAFSFGRSARELQAIDDAMASLKVLGLNPKNARRYGGLIREKGKKNQWSALIAGMCDESRLPILTDRVRDFRDFPGLVIVPTRMVAKYTTGEEILEVARNAGLKRRGEKLKG